MKRSALSGSIFTRSAGPRLRCFLSIGLIAACTFALAAQSAQSQFKYLKPLHLAHVYGYVFDESGKPLVGIQVVLASGGLPSLAMNTDDKGYFDFPEAKGEYLLHVKIPGLVFMDRQIIVGSGSGGQLNRGPVYVMMRSPKCKECTSEVFTNKKLFEQTIRETTGNQD
jgi:hypothetical protein